MALAPQDVSDRWGSIYTTKLGDCAIEPLTPLSFPRPKELSCKPSRREPAHELMVISYSPDPGPNLASPFGMLLLPPKPLRVHG